MNTLLAAMLFLASILMLAQGCAREKKNPESYAEQPVALADNPNAHLSETLQRLRGRWVLEVADPKEPNPTTMRLFAISDNVLSGRMVFAGPFDDTGVAATLVQSGDKFTLTLVDDDLRTHDTFPKQRVFNGTYDALTTSLNFKTDNDGEDMKFEIPGGYGLKFSGNVYRCVMIHTPDGPTPVGGGVVSTTPGTVAATPGAITTTPGAVVAPPVSSTPGVTPVVGGGGGSGWLTLASINERNDSPATNTTNTTRANPTHPATDRPGHVESPVPAPPGPGHTTNPNPTATPTPSATPGPEVPKARLTTCGVLNSDRDQWSRMSGTGGQ